MGCVTLCIQPEDEMLPDIYHLNSKAITEGHLCTTQAVVTQVGRISRAMTYVLFGRDSESPLFSWLTPGYSITGPGYVRVIYLPIPSFLILGTIMSRFSQCIFSVCLSSAGACQNVSRNSWTSWAFGSLPPSLLESTASSAWRSDTTETRGTVSQVFSWDLCFSTFSIEACWIKREFTTDQAAENILVDLVAGLISTTYIVIFAVMKKWFIFDDGAFHWYKNYRLRHPEVEFSGEENEFKAIANLMLLWARFLICVVVSTVVSPLIIIGCRIFSVTL